MKVETENDSSEEFDKILIEENFFDEIIETAYNLDTDTKVNLNSISLLESSESSLGIDQLKVSIEEHDQSLKKILRKII